MNDGKVTIRFKPEEKMLLQSLAEFNHLSLSKLIKDIVLDEVENNFFYDLAISRIEESKSNNEEYRPIEELFDEYDIQY